MPGTEAICQAAQVAGVVAPTSQAHPPEPELHIEDRKIGQEDDTDIQIEYKKLQLSGVVLCRKMIDSNTQEIRLQVVCPIAKCHKVWKKYHEAVAQARV